ncbi:AAA family ATPase, partial [Aporhodopirellula aestuarii]
ENQHAAKQRTPLVHGLLRRGETMNVIAAPKIGKSWLVHGLARSVAKGCEWLGFPCSPGRVLVVDAELHTSELAQRLRAIALETEANTEIPIDILALRGQMLDIHGVSDLIGKLDRVEYDLVVIDALYRFLPQGVSENDNAQMMGVYNTIDSIATSLDAGVVIVHHSSKGDQSAKQVTDLGSGAGSISRATDTHVAIRPHREEGLAVLQAVCRSFPPPDDISIRWQYPRWERVDCEAKIGNARQGQQWKRDQETDQAIRLALSEAPMSIAQLRNRTQFGQARVERSLQRLGAKSSFVKDIRTGKGAERFALTDMK